MPIYEYICCSCGLKFELLRPFSKANEEVSCPHCHGGAERRLSIFASFTKSGTGESTPIAGSGPSCAGCSSSSCSTCGL